THGFGVVKDERTDCPFALSYSTMSCNRSPPGMRLQGRSKPQRPGVAPVPVDARGQLVWTENRSSLVSKSEPTRYGRINSHFEWGSKANRPEDRSIYGPVWYHRYRGASIRSRILRFRSS